MATCIVCFEGFNKSARAPTKCPYCETQICRTCLQTYLLHDISDTPQCVNSECKHGYTREFLDGETTKSFRLHTYKDHREKVLIDREKARLPATQEDAAEYQTASKVLKEESEKLVTLQKEFAMLQRQIDETSRKCVRANTVIHTYGRTRLAPRAQGPSEEPEQTTKQAFIKPCPADDCKGFLSTAWKCGMCEQWTCPDCGEVKGANRDVEHTCDPDKVATTRMLAKEAKSCPKCGVQICKIEGCDQMWCTVCNTGFNWRTGKIASGPVHNPHYFEYLRKQGLHPTNTQMPQGNCDFEMDRNVTNALGAVPYARRHEPKTQSKDEQYLLEAWRLMREAEDPYANRNDTNHQESFRQMRVRYMVGELSEEDWKTALQRAEKDANFQMAKNQVKEVFANASRDLIRQVLEPNANKAEIRKQVEELIAYCNASYVSVSERFNRKVSLIQVEKVSKPKQLENEIVR
jgi:hypothetical protein